MLYYKYDALYGLKHGYCNRVFYYWSDVVLGDVGPLLSLSLPLQAYFSLHFLTCIGWSWAQGLWGFVTL